MIILKLLRCVLPVAYVAAVCTELFSLVELSESTSCVKVEVTLIFLLWIVD